MGAVSRRDANAGLEIVCARRAGGVRAGLRTQAPQLPILRASRDLG